MKLNTSYRQIWTISAPIMLASASQNIIVLCDNIFLYHYDNLDFGAIAIVGLFYLIISSIGFGITRGGQILIARWYGAKHFSKLSNSFHNLLFFQVVLALVFFLLIQFGSEPFFDYFVKSEEYFTRCLEYIYPRSYGIFFSYVGLSFIGLYTGIARTRFIITDTIILTLTNVVLNYVLIFDGFGVEGMGIRGAGMASAISEVVAFAVFVVYMYYDKFNRHLRLFTLPRVNGKGLFSLFRISWPIVLQTALGLGSWFVFFSMIEFYRGGRDLEVSNVIRIVYLILSIPIWGYSSGINTLVSGFIGQKKRQAVVPMIWKTSKLSVLSSILLAVPVVLWPDFFLYPLFGGVDNTLIILAKPVMGILLVILLVFSIGSIYMNGMMGTGETGKTLKYQVGASILYLTFIYYVVRNEHLGLKWAWSAEIVYWGFILLCCVYYLYSNRWHKFKI